MSDLIGIEAILEYVRNTALPRIDGTGDYNNNIDGKISRTIFKVDNSKMPFLFIVDTGVKKYTPMTACEMTTGYNVEGLERGYEICILGNVYDNNKNAYDGALDTKMNYLISDIVRAMETDITFGGLINSCMFTNSAKSLVEPEYNMGELAVWYQLKFDFSVDI